MSDPLITLKDALIHELKDLYSAEQQLLAVLPKMAEKASNEKLEQLFLLHAGETKEQVKRLEKISSILGEKLGGKTCKAMKGLIEEGKELLEEESDNEDVLDALLIGAAQRIEHYEMAAYGTARTMADELGEDEISKLLQKTLDEEGATDRKLSLVSEEEVLPDALGAGDVSESEGARL